VVRKELAVITNITLCKSDSHIQMIINNTIKQILDIINREYLIFSVDPKILPPDVARIIQQLRPFAPEVFKAYQELARSFQEIVNFRYQQLQIPDAQECAGLSGNIHTMFGSPVPEAAYPATPGEGQGDGPAPTT
jgi:hypothetical protein